MQACAVGSQLRRGADAAAVISGAAAKLSGLYGGVSSQITFSGFSRAVGEGCASRRSWCSPPGGCRISPPTGVNARIAPPESRTPRTRRTGLCPLSMLLLFQRGGSPSIVWFEGVRPVRPVRPVRAVRAVRGKAATGERPDALPGPVLDDNLSALSGSAGHRRPGQWVNGFACSGGKGDCA